MKPRKRKRRSRARQQSFEFPKHGGQRRGSGRPTLYAKRMGPEHAKRRAFRNRPVHVTMRMRHDVRANLRRGKAWRHARAVLRATRAHLGCRIVHFAVLGNHLHLIVEASDDTALRAAMKGFAVRMARRVNACLVGPNGLERKGQVFAFRYDTHVLEKPLETRNVILYVLNNAKKHAAEAGRHLDRFWLDPCSSAPSFDGWIPEAEIWLARPGDDDDALVVRPTHWLLTTGWRKHGLLDPGALPRLRVRVERAVPRASGSSGAYRVAT